MSIEPCHQNRKDTSTGSDWAGAAGNFSESSGGGTRRERPGRPKRTPARRCAGPGPADAPFRSGGGGTGEGAPPPAGPAARRPLPHGGAAPPTPPNPSRPLRPRPGDSPGSQHGRCLEVSLLLLAQTWAGRTGATGVPAPRPLASSPGTYPAAAAAAPRPLERRPRREGK